MNLFNKKGVGVSAEGSARSVKEGGKPGGGA